MDVEPLTHRTDHIRSSVAFGSDKTWAMVCEVNVSDINLKHERYEERRVALCVNGSARVDNIWTVLTLHELVGGKGDSLKLNVRRKSS